MKNCLGVAPTILAVAGLLYSGIDGCQECQLLPIRAGRASSEVRITELVQHLSSILQEALDRLRELPPQSQFTTVPLLHTNVVEATNTVRARLGKKPNFSILADTVTNTALIRGSAETTRQAKEILRRLDVEVELCIIPLTYADAAESAEALSILLGKGHTLHVVADKRTNSIIISANHDLVQLVKEAIGRLDGNAK